MQLQAELRWATRRAGQTDVVLADESQDAMPTNRVVPATPRTDHVSAVLANGIHDVNKGQGETCKPYEKNDKQVCKFLGIVSNEERF